MLPVSGTIGCNVANIAMDADARVAPGPAWDTRDRSTSWGGAQVVSANLKRRLFAEFLGSAFLGALVIGSGIAAAKLSPGNVGLELFECAAVVGAGLYTIILMIGPVSGGHVNPVVSLVDASFGGLRWRDAFAYIPAQVCGCVAGAIVANGMFARSAVSIATTHRASGAHLLAEVVATLGLLLVIFSLARTRRAASAPAAVGAYIAAACFFTSSSVCANPALAVGRIFSNSFAGFAPASVTAFVAAELVGGLVAIAVVRILYPGVTAQDAARVLMPHAGAARSGPDGGGAAVAAAKASVDGATRSEVGVARARRRPLRLRRRVRS
jgi:glycerol uptake facilitator-like aquaporin